MRRLSQAALVAWAETMVRQRGVDFVARVGGLGLRVNG